jgi:hypothetical protein
MREDMKAMRRENRDGQIVLRRRGGRHADQKKIADKRACRGRQW